MAWKNKRPTVIIRVRQFTCTCNNIIVYYFSLDKCTESAKASAAQRCVREHRHLVENKCNTNHRSHLFHQIKTTGVLMITDGTEMVHAEGRNTSLNQMQIFHTSHISTGNQWVDYLCCHVTTWVPEGNYSVAQRKHRRNETVLLRESHVCSRSASFSLQQWSSANDILPLNTVSFQSQSSHPPWCAVTAQENGPQCNHHNTPERMWIALVQTLLQCSSDKRFPACCWGFFFARWWILRSRRQSESKH